MTSLRSPATVASYCLLGINSIPLTVRCEVQPGAARFEVSGVRPHTAREIAVRVRSAMENIGHPITHRGIAVSVLPPDMERFVSMPVDLAIASAVLVADGMDGSALDGVLVAGELGLDGSVRPVRGVLAACHGARAVGMRSAIVPAANEAEARAVEGLEIYPVTSLSDIVDLLRTGTFAVLHPSGARAKRAAQPDMSEVRCQPLARRALEIAAAGGHSLLLEGPPGTGKTMFARRLPTILPPLTTGESYDTTKVYSALGLNHGGMIEERPFRAPHHTISLAAMLGGGGSPRPGEISLAHNGVLFLDDLNEFDPPVRDGVRVAMQNRSVSLDVGSGTVRIPASVQLIGAMNPCPCGWRGCSVRECICSTFDLERYNQRATPFRAMFTMRVRVEPLSFTDLRTAAPGESSESIRARVIAARARRPYGGVLGAAQDVRRLADTQIGVRARRVARTIADLAGATDITSEHMNEAETFV